MSTQRKAIVKNTPEMNAIDLMPSISMESLYNLPDCLVFLKDRQGRYLDCSQVSCDFIQLPKEELLNKSDEEFSWRNDSKKWRENELKVMATNKSMHFYEELIFQNKQNLFLSIKLPVHHGKKTIGTLGICKLQQQTELKNESNLPVLSKRELEALYYLIKNFPIKQIAQVMKISPRTVEHHINNAKMKLNCYNRCELIAKTLQLPDIKNKLFIEIMAPSIGIP